MSRAGGRLVDRDGVVVYTTAGRPGPFIPCLLEAAVEQGRAVVIEHAGDARGNQLAAWCETRTPPAT